MDPATRLKRHAQLWSASETRVRRIGIGGAIFALIILLSVIEPYYIESGTRATIRETESEVETLKEKLGSISEVEKQLGNMVEMIKNQPWTKQLQTLKDDFADGAITQPRNQSNDVLDAIATDLKKEIVAPLREATTQLAGNNNLSKVPDELDASVEKWLKKFKQVNWWITVDRKDDTARAIGTELTKILQTASDNASAARKGIESEAKTKTDDLEKAKKAVETLKTDLQKVMDRALPAWARGMLNVDQLLVVYPWVLAGLALYLVATGWRGSRHFHAMADGEGWSAEERRDPLLSSSWTLTNRGLYGSIATFLSYGSVLGVLGLCLYRHYYPPTTPDAGSVQATANAIAEQSSIATTIAAAFLVGAMFLVIAALIRSRPASESG